MSPVITVEQLMIRVPESGVVRVPAGGYPHEFASMPNGWREIAFMEPLKPQWIVVPVWTRGVLLNISASDGAGTDQE